MDIYYSYKRSGGRLTTADHEKLQARKARFRKAHREELAAKQRLYRQEKQS